MKPLDFSKEYILENDSVKLIPLKPEDFNILSTFSLNEPTLWEYSLQPANGLDNLKSYLDKALQDKADKKAYPFLVFDKRTNEYAGSTRFYDYQEQYNTIQLGYTWYGKAFQGTGLNKNCKFLMLSLAFETLGVERVEFRADNNNKRSIAAMKSLGCTVEGILRQNCATPNGARRDSIILSILKDEWFDGIKTNLESRL
ncbi:GNAT family N-acetyltransferase [Lacinutrix sp. Bg11-31]|uniref:GNAT family N-acetyltransferase n=1 Tax=Lacinutrix sp. Bg11-31 TaxID=2057808 RepID=UPI000C30E1AC|nr:GNAT family protein [Lacinutrix sp. Bg11-31]AUC81384.1 N-acetyltransferase [Lacinutrix sp. Bg11-31]